MTQRYPYVIYVEIPPLLGETNFVSMGVKKYFVQISMMSKTESDLFSIVKNMDRPTGNVTQVNQFLPRTKNKEKV